MTFTLTEGRWTPTMTTQDTVKAIRNADIARHLIMWGIGYLERYPIEFLLDGTLFDNPKENE